MQTDFLNAIAKEDIAKVAESIQLGADINKPTKPGLSLQTKRLSIIFSESVTPLMIAAVLGNLGIAKLLLEKGAKVDMQMQNKPGFTALIIAVGEGYLEMVKLFLSHKATVNQQENQFGRTALIIAAGKIGSEKRDLEIVKLLLPSVADVNQQDKNGMTALMQAARTGHPTVVRLLLESGAKTDMKNKEGQTTLEIAEKAGKTEIVKIIKEFTKKR